MEPITVTAFRLGQSTVVTLPKKLGIKPGTKLQISQSKNKINFTKAKENQELAKNLAYVKKHAGCLKYKAKAPYPTLKEMSDAYEKDTYGSVFPGY